MFRCSITGIKADTFEDLIKKYQWEVVELRKRNKISIKKLHNIREHSIVYTPIAEGVQEVIRDLKGRVNKNDNPA